MLDFLGCIYKIALFFNCVKERYFRVVLKYSPSIIHLNIAISLVKYVLIFNFVLYPDDLP